MGGATETGGGIDQKQRTRCKQITFGNRKGKKVMFKE